jgi:hypothetical protein
MGTRFFFVSYTDNTVEQGEGSIDHVLHLLHVLLKFGQDLGNGVQGDGDRKVLEHLLDDLKINALGWEKAGTRVPAAKAKVRPCHREIFTPVRRSINVR